jgi:hypothetical protein
MTTTSSQPAMANTISNPHMTNIGRDILSTLRARAPIVTRKATVLAMQIAAKVGTTATHSRTTETRTADQTDPDTVCGPS